MGNIFSAIVGAITWVVDKVGQLFGWVDRVRPTVEWMTNSIKQIINTPMKSPFEAVRLLRQMRESEYFQQLRKEEQKVMNEYMEARATEMVMLALKEEAETKKVEEGLQYAK